MDKLTEGLTKAGEKLESGDWVTKAVEKGKKEAAKLPESVRHSASEALDRLEKSKGALGTVSGGTFTAITSYLALGNEAEARALWLREKATHAERMSALDAAIKRAEDAQAAREAAWEELKKTALDILVMLGKQAIPLLLMAI